MTAAPRLRPIVVRLLLVASALAGPGVAAAQDGLGRLFFTPAQRAQLDQQRGRPGAPEPGTRAVGAAARQAPASLAIDGIVRRSDGQATVWLNREPTLAPAPHGPVRIGPVGDAAEGADLRLPDSGRRVRIKVGQQVDVQTGKVEERYRQPVPPTPAPPAGTEPSGAPRDSARQDRRLDEPARDPGRDAEPSR